MTRPYRLAYLVSHPIQYQAPLLRFIAADPEIDLTVFFLSDFSLREHHDPGFGAAVKWDVPLLEGYKSIFLPALGGTALRAPLRPFSHGLTRHLKSGRFDALWLHGYAHQVNLRALFLARRLGIKVYVRTDAQMGSLLGRPFVRRAKNTALRALFSRIDGFLASGTLNRDYFLHYGAPAEKVWLLPYAVDNDFFQAQAALAKPGRGALRDELGLTPGRPVILFASKFIHRKRAADLLEAYARLSPDGKQEPVPYLLFVGDGEDRTRLEARVAELGWSSVKLLGFKNQTELPHFFDLCDVFVLPSAAEPWGLIVNEVMNASRPVIVTDQVGAAPDLVRDGENGFVIPVGDVSALADRLQRLTSDPGLSEEMGAQGLRRINEWGFEQNLQGLRQVLQATVGPLPGNLGK